MKEALARGHALVTGDFPGLGYDQIVAGWRKPSSDHRKVGLKFCAPEAKDGSRWKLHSVIDDNKMAREDKKAADLYGDGNLKLIAAGHATKNFVIHWNKSGQ